MLNFHGGKRIKTKKGHGCCQSWNRIIRLMLQRLWLPLAWLHTSQRREWVWVRGGKDNTCVQIDKESKWMECEGNGRGKKRKKQTLWGRHATAWQVRDTGSTPALVIVQGKSCMRKYTPGSGCLCPPLQVQKGENRRKKESKHTYARKHRASQDVWHCRIGTNSKETVRISVFNSEHTAAGTFLLRALCCNTQQGYIFSACQHCVAKYVKFVKFPKMCSCKQTKFNQIGML